MTSNTNHLAVILPVYNFAGHLDSTLSKLKAWRDAHSSSPIDLIFSDDGSTDKSAVMIKSWIAQQKGGWHLVSQNENTGKGGAIQRGLKFAQTLNPEFIVFSDCDLHYGLQIIFDRMLPALATADVAIVDRSWKRDQVRASALRRLASAIFNRSVAILTGVAFRDTQAGLKAFRAQACWPVFELLTIKGFTFDVEILSISLFYRLRVQQVPITISKESATTTVSLLRSSLIMTRDLFKINWNWKTRRYEHATLLKRIDSEIYDIRD